MIPITPPRWPQIGTSLLRAPWRGVFVPTEDDELENGLVNVRDYGVRGDARLFTDAATTSSSGTVTSATGDFTASDVGKKAWVVDQSGTWALEIAVGTVTAVNSATELVLSQTASNTRSNCYLFIGTDNTDQIITAYQAAKAASPRKDLYFPRGGYFFNRPIIHDVYASLQRGVGILGDGPARTLFYPTPDFDFDDADHPCTQSMLLTQTNVCDTELHGFGMNGGNFGFIESGLYAAQNRSSGRHNSLVHTSDIEVRDFRDISGFFASVGGLSGFPTLSRISCVACSNSYSLSVASCSILLEDCFTSNSGVGLWLYNCPFVEVRGGWYDECSNYSMLIEGCTKTVLRPNVVYIGSSFIGIYVISNSEIVVDGARIVPFHLNNNCTGITIASGSTVRVTNSTITSNGTGKAINNSGTCVDAGGNVWTGDISGTISAPNDYVT